MAKLLVGQYIDSYLPVIDGVVNTVRNYDYWINKKHGSCYIATSASPGYTDDEDSEVYRFLSLPIFNRAPYRWGLPFIDIEFQLQQKRTVVDILHAHSPFMAGQEALRLAKERKIPIVATFHSKYYDDFLAATKSAVISKQMLKYVVNFYNKVDAVWAVNNGTADTLRSYGYDGEIKIMPNGVETVQPENPEELKRMAENTFNIRPEDTVFIFVGQQVFQKNTRMLLEALAMYKKTGARFKMLMVGEGNARPDLAKIAQELGIEEEVIFTGLIRDRDLLNGCYLRAEMMLFPSIYDNAPLVVREAAVMGRCSILVKGSNAAEGVEDGVNGYLCKNTVESLSSKITEAMSDGEKRARVSLEAHRTIPVSWEFIVDHAVAEYEKLIEKKKERARARKPRKYHRVSSR